jgi:hypothetical protein
MALRRRKRRASEIRVQSNSAAVVGVIAMQASRKRLRASVSALAAISSIVTGTKPRLKFAKGERADDEVRRSAIRVGEDTTQVRTSPPLTPHTRDKMSQQGDEGDVRCRRRLRNGQQSLDSRSVRIGPSRSVAGLSAANP